MIFDFKKETKALILLNINERNKKDSKRLIVRTGTYVLGTTKLYGS
jgi:hypothetical protein